MCDALDFIINIGKILDTELPVNDSTLTATEFGALGEKRDIGHSN